jgi:hypothetical protein
MADKKVVKYIKDNQKKGFSNAEIRKALLKAKYKKELVDEAFNYLEQKAMPKINPALLVGAIVLITLILLIVFVSSRSHAPAIQVQPFDMAYIVECNNINPAEGIERYNSCVDANTIKINSLADCDTLLGNQAKNLCRLIAADDVGACGSFDNPDFCKLAFAMKANDLSLCESIGTEVLLNNCRLRIDKQALMCMGYDYIFKFN